MSGPATVRISSHDLFAITNHQAAVEKVGTVALWVFLTNGLALVLAWLTNRPDLIAAGPLLNVVGVTVQKLFQTEEDQAIANLPANLQPAATRAAQEAAALPGQVIKPTPKQITVTEPDAAPEPAAENPVANPPA